MSISASDFDTYRDATRHMLCMGIGDGRFLVMTNHAQDGLPTFADWLLTCYTSEEAFFEDADDAYMDSWSCHGYDLDAALQEATFCTGWF